MPILLDSRSLCLCTVYICVQYGIDIPNGNRLAAGSVSQYNGEIVVIIFILVYMLYILLFGANKALTVKPL